MPGSASDSSESCPFDSTEVLLKRTEMH